MRGRKFAGLRSGISRLKYLEFEDVAESLAAHVLLNILRKNALLYSFYRAALN